MPRPWKLVWITGASTGIGRELALLLAGEGVKVAASARSADKLAELASGSPNIVPYPVDVADRAAMLATANAIANAHGAIDLVVLNAGTWDAMGARDFGADRAMASMAVNYAGVANGVEAVLPAMIARRGGHVAMVSSVAGYRGLPKASAYAPTKAAVISLAETLRPELAAANVRVSVINPGFVATPLTAINKFPMPFMISAADAAARIANGLEKGKFEIAFPWQLVGLMKFARVLPYPLFFWYARNFLARPPKKS